MNYQELLLTFQNHVSPSHPNEWEVEEVLNDLVDLQENQQRILLQTIPTIWPISHSLCFSVLKVAAKNVHHISSSNIAEWLRRILHQYERGGLVKARAYMAKSVKSIDIELHDNSAAVYLEQYSNRFTSFARGLCLKDIALQSSNHIYTDTDIIFLPEKMKHFAHQEENILMYKLLLALQCGFIQLGTFSRQSENAKVEADSPVSFSSSSEIQSYFLKFSNPRLLQNLFQLCETARVMEMFRHLYPGLVCRTGKLRQFLFTPDAGTKNTHGSILNTVYRAILLPEARAAQPLEADLQPLTRSGNARQSWQLAENFYEKLVPLHTTDFDFSFLPFMNSFNFAEALQKREERIQKNTEKLTTALVDQIRQMADVSEASAENKTETISVDDVKIQLREPLENAEGKLLEASITIENGRFDLPDDLLHLIQQIKNDSGSLPQGIVSAAHGIAGEGKPPKHGGTVDLNEAGNDFLPYDEWDFRRQGYRKNWCSLRERTLRGVKSDFVERTRAKYSGALRRIRRQFEHMRTQERFARRQRQGDDIDLDALVDSLGDASAGLPPSENLFIRLLRNERNIATVFLVDMSNSTEGWVGNTIKEALVLLCEAIEMVGDRYAIFGFSGMRRMRSEIYKIKDLHEPYGTEVKSRLAAISPKEYTRMGPPLRHMIKYFSGVDSKTRLLIILSDGKPEDYDDYKGQYALEDTRKALAEARGNNIHPYCITIDRQAESYLEYLFGAGQYTFVKKIDQLPSRLTEIYRLLTR